MSGFRGVGGQTDRRTDGAEGLFSKDNGGYRSDVHVSPCKEKRNIDLHVSTVKSKRTFRGCPTLA